MTRSAIFQHHAAAVVRHVPLVANFQALDPAPQPLLAEPRNPTPTGHGALREAPTNPPGPQARAQNAGFSMIELVLSLGILSFAFLALFALLPAGISTFHQALHASVALQLGQRMVNEALESDFNAFVRKPPVVRYFDDQANELPSAKDAIYYVNVRVQAALCVPGSADANANLAGITVQVANNPGGKAMLLDSNGLWTVDPVIPMTFYSTFLAGNSMLSPR